MPQASPEGASADHIFENPDGNPCENKLVDSPFIVELCAGSGRVTSCARAIGLTDSFGVDHKHVRNSGKVLVVDLTTKSGKELCRQWIQAPNLLGVFMAPPCGTCSRARQIPVRSKNGKTLGGPRPLRSDLQPNGIVGLGWHERVRVSAANRLYEFLTEVALSCIATAKIVVIENPRSSIYWLTDFFKPLIPHLKFTAHQACAYGSRRPKWTALAHNAESFGSINACCPGVSKNHKHDPWGVTATGFATAEETAYPLKLAYAIAHAFANEAAKKGWQPPSGQLVPPNAVKYTYLRAIVGTQPKASRIQPILSEFERVIQVVASPNSVPVQPGQQLSSQWNSIPPGAKFLKHTPVRIMGGNDDNEAKGLDESGNKTADNKLRPPDCSTCSFGIFRDPKSFVRDAVDKGHPVSLSNHLPGPLEQAIQNNVNMSAKELNAGRLAVLKEWTARAKDLQSADDVIKSKMPCHVRSILKPKRVALWKHLLERYQYPDMGVVDEMVDGTCLTGVIPPVPLFESKFRPATISVGELSSGAGTSRVALLHSIRSSGDGFVDKEVYRKRVKKEMLVGSGAPSPWRPCQAVRW